ncbi:hypothetical protein EON67_07115 [archaeon]|nr:MAG: hypothetical protein EON67_07115 [archaeon]
MGTTCAAPHHHLRCAFTRTHARAQWKYHGLSADMRCRPTGCRYEGNWSNDQPDGNGTFWRFKPGPGAGASPFPRAHARAHTRVAHLSRHTSTHTRCAHACLGPLLSTHAPCCPAARVPGTRTSGQLVKEYEGDFYEGLKHGSGRMYFDNGDVYVARAPARRVKGEAQSLHAMRTAPSRSAPHTVQV